MSFPSSNTNFTFFCPPEPLSQYGGSLSSISSSALFYDDSSAVPLALEDVLDTTFCEAAKDTGSPASYVLSP